MHIIGVIRYQPSGKGVADDIVLHECDECGAVTSDPDLHVIWHNRSTKETSK